MKEEILNWLSKKAININYLDNNEFIHIEENIQLYFREKDFKISELTNIWKWYFQNKVNIYSDENINKLKEYIEEVMEFNENYNYDQNDVYVREIVTQTGFSSLISQFERNFFVIPKSQRNYVWTKEKVENLAVSLVRGLPIPPIYAYRNNQNQLVVLDGQQRLTSLYLYSKGIYISGKEKNNAINLKSVLSDENKLSAKEEENSFLKKLDDNFTVEKVDYRLRTIGGFSQNINYESLNPEIKALVDTRALTIIEILVMGTDNKEEVYYNIFGNLNQGGAPLTNQELRNGIYKSEFYDMLHSINNDLNGKWRELYGAKHNRDKDTELLLRYIACEYMFQFKDGEFILERHVKNNQRIDEFKSSYPKLLNDFSKIARNFNKEEVIEYKNKLLNFFKRVDYPTEVSKKETTKRVYNSLLESIYIADCKINKNYTIDKELIEKIKTDEIYKSTIHAGSSSKNKVQTRLNRVYNIILEYFGEKNGL